MIIPKYMVKENKLSNRDIQLDMYRGLVMLYIVCWIHVVYWLNMPVPHKGYFLIEMPIIFFIAGASSRYSRPKEWIETVRNRFNRVFVPYYLYAFLCLTLLIGATVWYGKSLLPNNMKEIIKILLAIELPHVPYAWHLWFILPYFIVSIVPKSLYNKVLMGGVVRVLQ